MVDRVLLLRGGYLQSRVIGETREEQEDVPLCSTIGCWGKHGRLLISLVVSTKLTRNECKHPSGQVQSRTRAGVIGPLYNLIVGHYSRGFLHGNIQYSIFNISYYLTRLSAILFIQCLEWSRKYVTSPFHYWYQDHGDSDSYSDGRSYPKCSYNPCTAIMLSLSPSPSDSTLILSILP